MNSFDGKTVLITGAAGGIGQAIAHLAAGSGANVVLGDVALDALAATAEAIKSAGGSVRHGLCDVRTMSQVLDLVSLAKSEFGGVDVAFANAGVEGEVDAPWDHSEEDFGRVIDINLGGAWRTMKAVLPDMVSRGSGAIVATASVAGLVGTAGLAPYVASKHGVVGLVRSVAISVAKAGVRVNALCPGMIETAMVDRLAAAVPDFRQALLNLKPMGRLGSVGEAAAAGLWLASDSASFVTGHALAVDGGYLAQ